MAIVEGDRVGGTCVIRGCIPKKLMVYASHAAEWMELGHDYGWSGHRDHKISWERLVAMRNAVVDRLELAHEGHLEKAGVELVRGYGTLTGPHRVSVAERTLEFDKLLIATGAAPVLPKIKGDGSVLTSDALFKLDRLPHSSAIIGGGYIALEFAGILNSLGSEVTVFVRDTLLRGFDQEVVAHLETSLAKQGLNIAKGALVEDAVHLAGQGYRMHYRQGGVSKELEVDAAVVFAIGRRPNTANLGLEEIGIELAVDGAVPVDEQHRSAVGHIFAVGDVINKANLTPVAIKAGRSVADREFAGIESPMSYENIPTAVFSYPPIGTVGLTEEEARERFESVRTYRSEFSPLIFAGSPPERKVRSFMKMVVAGDDERVVGLHMVGLDAPEIIQGFGVAVGAGLTKAHFDQTIAVHPSSAEEFVLMKN